MAKCRTHNVSILLTIATLVAVLYSNLSSAQNAGPEGFTIKEVRFDESMGKAKPTPRIPSTWRFVGVSNGEKRNSNNLWFQDREGNIYLVQGFTSDREFVLIEDVEKISGKK
jgi:hypothetical protein